MIIHCCLPWGLTLASLVSLSLLLFSPPSFGVILSLTHSTEPLACSPPARGEDKNRAHGATKEQIACRQECPDLNGMLCSRSKKKKKKRPHFQVGSFLTCFELTIWIRCIIVKSVLKFYNVRAASMQQANQDVFIVLNSV